MIETRHLFPILDAKLIEVLKSLDTNDWNKPTVAKLWTVKDIASHLLDGNLRALSISRDRYSIPPDRQIGDYSDLVQFLNQLNADWVNATRRLSPAVLIDLLETTGQEHSAHIQTLDPEENAIFSVAWAGEQTSKNWFHIAREYTEKWHHQQQIRKATNRAGIMTKELFHPFISTLLLGLPHAYRYTKAALGSVVQISVTSEIGGNWYLIQNEQNWEISNEATSTPVAALTINPEIAWQLFTKALKPEEIKDLVEIEGQNDLAKTALTMIAVMA